MTADAGRLLTTERFHQFVGAAGYQYLAGDEVGDPSGRTWTECGQIDRLGHSLRANVGGRVALPSPESLRAQSLRCGHQSSVGIGIQTGWWPWRPVSPASAPARSTLTAA